MTIQSKRLSKLGSHHSATSVGRITYDTDFHVLDFINLDIESIYKKNEGFQLNYNLFQKPSTRFLNDALFFHFFHNFIGNSIDKLFAFGRAIFL